MSEYWHMQQCRSISKQSVCSCLMPQTTHFSCCLPKPDYPSTPTVSLWIIDAEDWSAQKNTSYTKCIIWKFAKLGSRSLCGKKCLKLPHSTQKGFDSRCQTLKHRSFMSYPLVWIFVLTFNVSFEFGFFFWHPDYTKWDKTVWSVNLCIHAKTISNQVHPSVIQCCKDCKDQAKRCRVIKTMHQKTEFHKRFV